jgi:hypothetical protein
MSISPPSTQVFHRSTQSLSQGGGTLARHAGLDKLTGARQAIAQLPQAYAKALAIDGPSRRTSE